MDFRFPPELVFPVAVALAFPLTLLCAGWHRGLRAHNAKRFFAAASLHTFAWVCGMLLLPPHLRSAGSWLLGALVWSSALLLYLEVWALLSRGYTLAMLLVLLKSPTPLTEPQIAAAYRGGAGLRWIMEHRAGGLAAAGLITQSPGSMALTRLGALVAAAYAVARVVLGLRSTG